MDGPLAERCQEHGVPASPGAVTATEVQMALEMGLRTVKFFPAGPSGGAAEIAALAAPFGEVKFVPTGGVGPKTLGDYLSIPAVAAEGLLDGSPGPCPGSGLRRNHGAHGRGRVLGSGPLIAHHHRPTELPRRPLAP